MKKPFITIAIPSLNRIESLKLVIQSVLTQTFNNYELLIVDDNSSDDIEGYLKFLRSKKIRFIRNKKSIGFKKMMIQTLLEARGIYVMTLGNDDILCDNHTLQNVYRALKQKEVGLAKLGLIYYYKTPTQPCFSTKLDSKNRFIKSEDYSSFFSAIDDYGLTHIAGTIYLRKLITKDSFLDNQLLPFFKTIVECGTQKDFLFIANEYVATGISTSYLSLFSQKRSSKELWFYIMYEIYSQYINKRKVKKMIVKKLKEQISFFVAIKSYVGIREVLMLIKEYIRFDNKFRYNIKLYLSFIISILMPKRVFIFIRDLRYKIASNKFRPPKKYWNVI